jgi:hypothetical protein
MRQSPTDVSSAASGVNALNVVQAFVVLLLLKNDE